MFERSRGMHNVRDDSTDDLRCHIHFFIRNNISLLLLFTEIIQHFIFFIIIFIFCGYI